MLYFFDLCSAFPLRLVEAIFSSSFSLIDEAIDFDAPFSLLFEVSPLFAERAAPAAFCCAADLAGTLNLLAIRGCQTHDNQDGVASFGLL